MNDVNPYLDEPVDEAFRRACERAPNVVSYNTVLMTLWAYVTLGEFVVARGFSEVIAWSMVVLLALGTYLGSEKRYADYLLDRSGARRIKTALFTVVRVVALWAFAVLVAAFVPESAAPTLLLLFLGGLWLYRVRVKRRYFFGLAPGPSWQTLALGFGLPLVTLVSLVSNYVG